MNHAWTIGRLAGIRISIHWTFLLLPAWAATSVLSAGGSLATAAITILFLLAVFGCVVLHELGHALMARHYHIITHDITLLPIGGVARLDRMPHQPAQELAVALAGPAVNLVIAISLALGFFLGGAIPIAPTGLTLAGSLLVNLFWVNLILTTFNLLPAFPMDGGRILRALLATHFDYVPATRIAVRIGQLVAAALAVAGVLANWMLVLVALFVVLAARAEREMVEAEAATDAAAAKNTLLCGGRARPNPVGLPF